MNLEEKARTSQRGENGVRPWRRPVVSDEVLELSCVRNHSLTHYFLPGVWSDCVGTSRATSAHTARPFYPRRSPRQSCRAIKRRLMGAGCRPEHDPRGRVAVDRRLLNFRLLELSNKSRTETTLPPSTRGRIDMALRLWVFVLRRSLSCPSAVQCMMVLAARFVAVGGSLLLTRALWDTSSPNKGCSNICHHTIGQQAKWPTHLSNPPSSEQRVILDTLKNIFLVTESEKVYFCEGCASFFVS